MSEQKKNIVIERIATPDGDVPRVEGVIEAFNIIIEKIASLSKQLKEHISSSGIDESSEIGAEIKILKDNFIELKKKVVQNEEILNDLSNKLNEIEIKFQNIGNNISESNHDLNNKSDLNISGSSLITELKPFIEQLLASSIPDNKIDDNRKIELNLNKIMKVLTPDDIKIKLDDLGGYKNIKEKILSIARLLNLPKKIFNYDSKIMLYGPPGNGKTSTVYAIAKELNVNLIEIDLPLLLSHSLKEQIEIFNLLINKLKNDETIKPCILLIENLHIINEFEYFHTILNNFNKLFDKIKLLKDSVLIICTTYELEKVDSSLLSRFDNNYFFSYPDEVSRHEILNKLLENVKLDENIDKETIISYLASENMTGGYSCRDLAKIIENAYFRSIKNEKEYITEDDIYLSYREISEKRNNLPIIAPKPSSSVITSVNPSYKPFEIKELESKIDNIYSQLIINRKMIKNALRLSLSENYDLVNRLVKLFETEQRPLNLSEIQKIAGFEINKLKKILKKEPFSIIFPTIGDNYVMAFTKDLFDEIITEFELKME